MITYLYWGIVFALVVAVIVGIGLKMDRHKTALVAAAIILFVGWAAYYFWLQQIFVKRWGGVMSISVPSGQYHIATTWKEDNLWVENYDPETNKCVFSEYSKGNLLQGRVTIKDCNPIMFLLGADVQRPSASGGVPETQDERAPMAAGGADAALESE
jgi:hypothetical protein